MSWTITGSEKTPVDPQFGSVSLLLHGDGANNSTTFTDSSRTPKTVTQRGNAKIVTGISDPFGRSDKGVMAFDALGSPVSRLELPASGLSLPGDFTIECFLFGAAQNSATFIYSSTFTVQTSGTGALLVFDGSNRNLNAFSPNQWVHIAISRSGSQVYGFVNGIQQATWTNNSSTTFSLNDGSIGGRKDQNILAWNGYIDDFRVTTVARYTANFTPPTAPFPDI